MYTSAEHLSLPSEYDRKAHPMSEEGWVHSTHRDAVVSVDDENRIKVTPTQWNLRYKPSVPKVGVMLVGWGGNNGSTFTATALANAQKLSWATRTGTVSSNWFGSLTQAGVAQLGPNLTVPLSRLVSTVAPADLVIGGWDINDRNLADAMEEAQVLEPTLQSQLKEQMAKMTPLPGIYDPSFIAPNQMERANHVLPGTDKAAHLAAVRADIRKFKAENDLDKVVVLWTANTERFARIEEGLNTTADDLLASIASSHPEVAPSTIFAVAALQEGVPFINGSPQNTLVPGLMELAVRLNVPVAGDDFKSGQTKIKSVLVDFLVSAGLKPESIVSYNHLGNNDGRNLSNPAQFESKRITKSNVVDDMVASNGILYPDAATAAKKAAEAAEAGSTSVNAAIAEAVHAASDAPDHVVVIKYVPSVGDSKRAMDEYTSGIMMNGKNTLVLHNTCEDSLLAVPLMLDLVVLTELFSRIQIQGPSDADFRDFHPIYSSLLSYFLKAPHVAEHQPLVNALGAQRTSLENLFKILAGLPTFSHLTFESK